MKIEICPYCGKECKRLKSHIKLAHPLYYGKPRPEVAVKAEGENSSSAPPPSTASQSTAAQSKVRFVSPAQAG